MIRLSRRRLLYTTGSIAVGSLTGCLGETGDSGSNSTASTKEGTKEAKPWTSEEGPADCTKEPKEMYSSAITIVETKSSVDDNESATIEYEDLSSGEQDLLDRVIERGSYETCQSSSSFGRFVDRVWDHIDGENERVYLERDGMYYRLYVKTTDVIVSY